MSATRLQAVINKYGLNFIKKINVFERISPLFGWFGEERVTYDHIQAGNDFIICFMEIKKKEK